MEFDFYKEAERSRAELIALIEALCAIPAPLHEERGRAKFVMNWLSEISCRVLILMTLEM